MPPFLRVTDAKDGPIGLVFTVAPEAFTQPGLHEGEVTIAYGDSSSRRVRQLPVSVMVIGTRASSQPTAAEDASRKE